MISRWAIRNKLILGAVLLLVIVTALSFSSFRGVYAYRQLARDVSHRAVELPLLAKLAQSATRLRLTVQRSDVERFPGGLQNKPIQIRDDFRMQLSALKGALHDYRNRLTASIATSNLIGDKRDEWEAVREIDRRLQRIDQINDTADWVMGEVPIHDLEHQLKDVERLTWALPAFLHDRMHVLADEVRFQYRAWIVMTWVTTAASGLLLLQLARYLYVSVIRPFKTLIRGSRKVAAGQFDYRIELDSNDEVGELAAAMNGMTEEFQRIRDDLDDQVQERTREVVQSERLASVGYLAAGVAHEINNPMASIAWCAESLESRMHDIIQEDDARPDGEHNEEITVLKKYLRRIQDEAFRCKGITEQLLDFSRLGDVERHETDLRELAAGVIEMIKHLGKYRNKQVHFHCSERIMASVNEQEIKQVVLNLVTNALDSLDPGGEVRVKLESVGRHANLSVADNGCGMTADVLKQIFEPFFTRRRDGSGTGLGLSISYRIISDHGGRIDVHSDGPGQGSTFRVTLPLTRQQEKYHEERRVA